MSSELPYLDPDGRNRRRLFFLSLFALATAGAAYSIRANIAGELQAALFDPVDRLRSAEMAATSLGIVFLGFAFTIAIGSPLLDFIGMGRLLALSSLCYCAGTGLVVFAPQLQGTFSLYHLVLAGMLITGIGQGLVETVINPLITSLYTDDKIRHLNTLHAWWPGGVIVGGLFGLAMSHWHLGWQLQLAAVLLPAMLFGAVAVTLRFPPTERVAAGVPARQMVKEALRPFFILWFLCMFLTAASELAPGQWVDMALTRTVGMKGIWLLIYVSGLMFVMRHFAGPLAQRFSPVGLLWLASLMAASGLLLLSIAHSPVTGLVAATVGGAGVCYMWPTMMGAVSERFPRGGALALGLMGTGGTLSIYFVLPQMGVTFDRAKIRAAGGEHAFRALHGDQLNQVLAYASQYSFRVVAILPAILLLAFGAVWLYDKSRGGYRPAAIRSMGAEVVIQPAPQQPVSNA